MKYENPLTYKDSLTTSVKQSSTNIDLNSDQYQVNGPILNGKTIQKAFVQMVIQQQSKKFKQCTTKLYGITSETVQFILHSIKHKQIGQNLLSLHGMKKAHLNELSHRERNL